MFETLSEKLQRVFKNLRGEGRLSEMHIEEAMKEMVAGLIAGQVQGLSLSDCARLATTFSLGAITQVGSHLPAPETLQAYGQQVTVRISTRVPRSA